MDEVHFPIARLRSSAELLTELQKSEGGESRSGQSNTSMQEIGATHVSSLTGNKETCANTLSVPPSQASLFTQRTIRTNEVISIKMNDNLTPQCIGTREGQYC